MTRRRIPRSLRQRVVTESRNQCTYCHTPTTITGARLVIDHIFPEAAGGQTIWANLCVACHACNEFKGAQVTAAAMARTFRLERGRLQHRWSHSNGAGDRGRFAYESLRHR
jgi:5-methylcytosine-specific restriction endonuclease McrA